MVVECCDGWNSGYYDGHCDNVVRHCDGTVDHVIDSESLW